MTIFEESAESAMELAGKNNLPANDKSLPMMTRLLKEASPEATVSPEFAVNNPDVVIVFPVSVCVPAKVTILEESAESATEFTGKNNLPPNDKSLPIRTRLLKEASPEATVIPEFAVNNPDVVMVFPVSV